MLTALLTFLVVVIMLLSCWTDIKTLRIPNWHTWFILAAFVPAYLLSPESFGKWWHHIGAMVLFFGVTYFMFYRNMLGGGDAKFGTALALWVGLKGLVPYMLYMSLVGGCLGLIALIFKKQKPLKKPLPGSWMEQAQNGRNAVPYGVAISAGAFIALLYTGFIARQIEQVTKFFS